MPDPRDWIACGCCELSTPFLCRFRQESTLSNPKKLASRFGVTLSVALPKSPRCPRTSSHDRFVLAARGSHCGFFPPLGRGHRYRFPLITVSGGTSWNTLSMDEKRQQWQDSIFRIWVIDSFPGFADYV